MTTWGWLGREATAWISCKDLPIIRVQSDTHVSGSAERGLIGLRGQKNGLMPVPVSVAFRAKSAHGAFDSIKLACSTMSCTVHFAQRGPANDCLEGEVVLKCKEVWRHYGRSPA